jgi:hypothetical protein
LWFLHSRGERYMPPHPTICWDGDILILWLGWPETMIFSILISQVDVLVSYHYL